MKSLHELRENKNNCNKACMLIYQTCDSIKESVHLGEGYLGFGPLPFFQTDQTVPLITSK